MLDEMRVLQDSVDAYRAAASTAGVAWPDRVAAIGPAPDLVYRLFDVDHVAEQLSWLVGQRWDYVPLLPSGGGVLPWPTDVGDSLDRLSWSFATPFSWRRQMPLFQFSSILYTFVLAGEREGEIWRYEADPDAWDSVRAATSLAALFTEWTKGIAAGLVGYEPDLQWLLVGGEGDPFPLLVERSPELDPFAFPVSISDEPLLRARQRECGVDMDRIQRGEYHAELLDVIAATRRSLGG
jgi:hypothetical protein